MKKLLFIIITLLMSSGFTVAQSDSLDMNTYVSIAGKCYIEYPANWHQIPHVDFDRYLASKKAGRPIYDYDAVFADEETIPFYSGTYFILSIEPVGKLSDKQIDSVLNQLAGDFGANIKYFPVADFMADMVSNAPTYDKKTKTVSIFNRIVKDRTIIKNSLIIMKFYDFGIATFYCYSLAGTFEDEKSIFYDVVNSLGTDDLESRTPKQTLKVADIDTTGTKYTDDDDDSSNFVIYVSLAVVLFLVVIRRRKRKK